MYTETFDEMLKANKYLIAPLSNWAKIAGEMIRRLNEQNLEIAAENFSLLANQCKRLSDAKKPEDFLALQKECLNENISTAMENVQKIVHHTIENIEACTKLYNNTQETFTSHANKAKEKHS